MEIPQIFVHPSGKNVPVPPNVEGRVTEMVKESDNGISETAGTAVQVKRSDVAH